MKPLLLDTTVWIEWLQGRSRGLVERSRERTLYMAAPVEMELQAGIHSVRSQRAFDAFLRPFAIHNRILVPGREDFRKAGEILADVGMSASKHATDALICVCARKIGAELWTLNRRDFLPFCRLLHVTIGPD